MTATILIVDDEPAVRFTVEEALTSSGFTVIAAAGAQDALDRLAGSGVVDAVVTDLVMPGMDGLALVAALRRDDPELPVIILTARGSERAAVEAMKAGAHDYLTKPFRVDELRLIVARAAEVGALRRAAGERQVEHVLGVPIVGAAPPWRKVVEQARRVARRDVTVLVTGETGTGKELIATLIHAGSSRADRPLVRFNCAAVAAELAEAELFGHVRGAFTGAVGDRRGFFAQADGGTLILDEVGELPASVQATLLRALQDGEIQPVGASRVDRVDVRVVACTHRDLEADVRSGRFRADLYYRLAVVTLRVPPLRERSEDIPALVDALRRRWAARFAMPEVRLTEALVAALAARSWPGNVRELENAVAGLLALGDGGVIDVDALEQPPAPTTAPPLRAQLDAYERGILERTLAEAGGNQSESARRLGIMRSTLIEKLKRHGLA